MSEHERMLDPAGPPDPAEVTEWIGARSSKRWADLTEFIRTQYPDVFETDWWFGGKKFGWSLRYKKSKSFCNLIPERGRFMVLLVFGAEERVKVEEVLPALRSHVRDDYEAATTYHDGKWVATVVDSRQVLADVQQLLMLKRRPKAAAQTAGSRTQRAHA